MNARLGFAMVFLFTAVAAFADTVTDPHLTTWLTARSAQYARVYETTSDKTSANAVSTWPRSGLTNSGGGQATATYADVQRVAYSTNYVYIYTTGLASYTMGNWLSPTGNVFMFWPTNRAAIHRIPRTVSIPTTKQKAIGVGGVWVNGVYLWENGDAQSYTTSTGQVSFNGQGIWNRLAGAAEAFNFDPANGHQPGSGAYHTHINPIGLRYQLGDNVTYNATTKAYAEAGTPTKHSPILGWALDGLPVYGPYGYSSPMDPTSGVRRMTSGFQKRDGTNGSTNLATAGRKTLPTWAASVQGSSTTLPSTEYGPNVSTTYPIGTFAEDYDYMGDLGKQQGVDFDLNRQNVRYCVTPEYPNGTYAYFVSIDAAGTTAFPDVINQEFFGSATPGQGTVTSINEPVTDYQLAGPGAAIAITAKAATAGVGLTWNSAEGATYKVESSADGATWSTESAAVTSGGLTTSYTTATASAYYRVTLTAIATYDSGGTYGTPVGKSATVQYATGTSSGGTTSGTGSSGTGSTTTGTTSTGTTSTGTTTTGTTSGGTTSGTGTTGTGSTTSGGTGTGGTSSGTTSTGTTSGTGGTSTGTTSTGTTSGGSTSGTGGTSTGTTTTGSGSSTSSTTTTGTTTTSGGTSTTTPPPAHLINLALRAPLGGPAGIPILGFTLNGSGGGKPLILRAVGPTLGDFGVAGVVADPQLQLLAGSNTIASNDNWLSADATAFTGVGAFPLKTGSADAAIVTTLAPGSYTMPVNSATSAGGVVLVECYDGATADATHSLVNASARAWVGTGDAVLIPGFVVNGIGTVRLLIRAIGPQLAAFGVGGAIADPQIVVFNGSTQVGANDNWSSATNAADVQAAAAAVSAFPLPSGSKDAAVLITVAPGSYSAVVSGVAGATGTALVEIYVVP